MSTSIDILEHIASNLSEKIEVRITAINKLSCGSSKNILEHIANNLSDETNVRMAAINKLNTA